METKVSGIKINELLPTIAAEMKSLAIIRSLTMTGRSIGDHHADTYYVLTGHQPDRSFFVEGINRKPHPGDWPCIGSTVASRLPPNPELPGLVQLPARSGVQLASSVAPLSITWVFASRSAPLTRK